MSPSPVVHDARADAEPLCNLGNADELIG